MQRSRNHTYFDQNKQTRQLLLAGWYEMSMIVVEIGAMCVDMIVDDEHQLDIWQHTSYL